MLHLLFISFLAFVFSAENSSRTLLFNNGGSVRGTNATEFDARQTLQDLKETCDALLKINETDMRTIFQNVRYQRLGRFSMMWNDICMRCAFNKSLYSF